LAVSTETRVHGFIYDGLDLSALMGCVQKTGLDAGAAAQAVACYRDFLWVCWYHWNSGEGSSLAAIDVRADAVWHCHMLQPDKYRQDCAQIFGAGVLLDHKPGGDAALGAITAPLIAAACAAYEAAKVEPPADPRPECVWSIVTP